MLQLFQQLAYPFQLPELPYNFNALEPHIDAQTMQIHHDKHHQAYVNNLNKLLESHPNLQSQSLNQLLSSPSELPSNIRQAIINHGGGHANHSLFWQIMGPASKPSTQPQRHSETTTNSFSSPVGEESLINNSPTGTLSEAINQTFTDFSTFQQQFTDQATKVFGSGWAWLVVSPDETLTITSTSNQDSPLSSGLTPLLTLDVWEHAYYLKYQNRRAEYIKAWWQVINWSKVGQLFAEVSD